MDRILTYGLKHRIPILGISLVYAVAAILYHEDAQEFVRLMQRDGMWGAVGVALFAVGIAAWGWKIGRSVGVMEKWSGTRRSPQGRSRGELEYGVGVWVGLVVLAVAGYVLLMSYPTEVVHYLQFGILGVLFSVALRRVDTAFVLTVVFGMLDEAYQYWWLHRAWGVYYDFNDVLLNIIAVALGLATVATLWPFVFVEKDLHAETQRTQRSQSKYERESLKKNLDELFFADSALSATLRDTSFLFGVLFVAAFTLGVWTDLIAIQTADVREHTLLLLNRMRPFETFWETFNGATSQHHVVRAWWGVVLTGIMTVGGVRVVERLRKELGDRS